MLRFIGALHPDREIFERAISGLSSSHPEELRRIGKFATALIDADGAISDAEFEFALQLREALRR